MEHGMLLGPARRQCGSLPLPGQTTGSSLLRWEGNNHTDIITLSLAVEVRQYTGEFFKNGKCPSKYNFQK